ncbi:uncharacterized protein LOC119099775 [Pollicipes pollicipes]|uniref:uncharacterized protein LOC119099775 n=1 Tax=Pollicipes pollicipes TaxID=41117 RepID=UPI001885933B|nr:uncharacterized protein LOC119099775 [Pollicipes pollicipes]
MTCPGDGAIYMYGRHYAIGARMANNEVEYTKRFACYQLRRPERDPLFWRTHLEKTELGSYYCKALYGFGTAREAVYLLANEDNVKSGFCFFAGGMSDMLRTVNRRWCQLSAGGVVAFRAWKK